MRLAFAVDSITPAIESLSPLAACSTLTAVHRQAMRAAEAPSAGQNRRMSTNASRTRTRND
jgi:hypothetical protein